MRLMAPRICLLQTLKRRTKDGQALEQALQAQDIAGERACCGASHVRCQPFCTVCCTLASCSAVNFKTPNALLPYPTLPSSTLQRRWAASCGYSLCPSLLTWEGRA